MMQSILLTPSSKANNVDSASQPKGVDGDLNIDGKNVENSAASRFSTLLESKLGVEGETEGEELTEKTLKIEISAEALADDELSEEISSDEVVDEGDVDYSLLSNEEPIFPDESIESLFDMQHIGTNKNKSDHEIMADATILIDSEADAPLENESDNKTNSLLAQIEAAQKTDTKVNTVMAPVVDKLSALSELKNQRQNITKDDHKTANASTDELLLAVDEESGLLTKVPGHNLDKLDPFIGLQKGDADKTLFSATIEPNHLRTTTLTGAGFDKTQNAMNTTTASMQSTALQQPLELQAKQASVMMGERIMMMIGQGKQEVTIRLDPAELGSMHIKLQVQQDQLHVAIHTQVGQSRDIIEQNLPRLREQLAQQGINLGEASVEQQAQQGQQQSQQANSGETRGSRLNELDNQQFDEQAQWVGSKIPLPAQGIDYYA